MRLIDADALKRKSQKAATEAWKLRIKATVEVILNQFIDYIDVAPNIKPEPQWIPCSMRLPEEDGLYLVTTSKGQVQVHVFTHNGNSKEYWMRCNKAWMLLPEPWKGDTRK